MNDLSSQPAGTAEARPEPRKKKRAKFRALAIPIFFLAGTVFLILSELLKIYANSNPAWLVNSYIPFSLKISEKLADFSGIFPFSLAELLLYIIFACVLMFLIIFITKAVRRTLKPRPVVIFLTAVYMASCCILLLFHIFWGLNYYAPPINSQIGLKEEPTSKTALLEAALWLRGKVNEYARRVPRGSDGACSFGPFYEVAADSASGFMSLAKVIPRFEGAYNNPKRILSWFVFSRSGIWGIYIPLTGESNVNPDVPDASLPFTVCHEMAHRLAVAPEQEANFVAFLASINSDSPIYRYSGYFSAFLYCYNAVAEVYPQELQAVAEGIDPYVAADFLSLAEHSKKNEGAVRELAESVNDNYLKSMSQDDGVLSYGRVVDLIIAYYSCLT